jgi:hypothetical protein
MNSYSINCWLGESEYPKRLQVILGSDAGQHEDLWRADGTGGNHDFLFGPDNLTTSMLIILDSVSSFRFVDENFFGQCVRSDE